MTVATVDLDDTLIVNKTYYDSAMEKFAEYMEEEHGIDPERAKGVLNEIDYERLDKLGLSKERFPGSFVCALEELLDDEPSEEEKELVYQFGKLAFPETEVYREEGFRDGTEIMLEEVQERVSETHLLTAGDTEIQEQKIRALNLQDHFDEIHIVGMGEKDKVISNFSDIDEEVVHIGNSESSDVKAALNANVKSVYLPECEWRGNSDQDYTQHPDVRVFDSVQDCTEEIRNEGGVSQLFS